MGFLSWKRFFARITDYGLFYLMGVILSLVLPLELEESFYLTFALLTPLLSIPLEAFYLSRRGTTPGKALFGISLSPLTFSQAFKRTLFFWRERPGEVAFRPIGRWRYGVAVLLALACGSSLFLGKDISEAAVDFEEHVVGDRWIEYSSEEGQFSVQFPKKPKLELHTVELNSSESLSLNEVKVEQEVTFSVSYIELPLKWRLFSSSTLLKGAMRVIVHHMPGSTMIDQKTVHYHHYPAMNFHLKQGDNEVHGRLILVDTKLYRLMVIYPPTAECKDQHEPFLSSFVAK
jgi:hypothetical protein